jgi:2-hydroxychromene-2-carboxylate isomerase
LAQVDFFFDFISPYTYLARTQLDGIAARTGARFNTRPMHLLNLMKIVGNLPTTVLCKNKLKYAGQDIARWCARYQVPFKLNPHAMQGDHSLTLKGALVAQEMNLEEQYDRAMFSAFWVEAGLDGRSILSKAEQAEYAKRLESNTQSAAERGVFGSPTFIVGDDLFFGNDRLDFLEAMLKEGASQKELEDSASIEVARIQSLWVKIFR